MRVRTRRIAGACLALFGAAGGYGAGRAILGEAEIAVIDDGDAGPSRPVDLGAIERSHVDFLTGIQSTANNNGQDGDRR